MEEKRKTKIFLSCLISQPQKRLVNILLSYFIVFFNYFYFILFSLVERENISFMAVKYSSGTVVRVILCISPFPVVE